MSYFIKALAVVMISSGPALALDTSDVPRMHSTYNANQARFVRDYKGKPFADRLKVKAVIESPVFRGQYMVQFGTAVFGDVSCSFADKKLIEFVTELNPGDVVRVTGTVADHVFGAVTLSECTLAPNS